MNHSVIFDNCDNRWDNALPLGNGCFGCMPFYQEDRLHFPMNHYEVYYNIRSAVLPEDKLAAQPVCKDPGAAHRAARTTADLAQPAPGEPFCNYRTTKDSITKEPYGMANLTGSYPSTGEIILTVSENLRQEQRQLSLRLEDAKVALHIGTLTVNTVVLRKDCLVCDVAQGAPDSIPGLQIAFPRCRDAVHPDIAFAQLDENTLRYTVSRTFTDGATPKTFKFCGHLRFLGASVNLISSNDVGAELRITTSEEKWTLLAGICTDFTSGKPEVTGLSLIKQYAENLDALRQEHTAYWKDFWGQSSISLPDKFLERIYYVNQYALDCCSGKDGIMKHHACGLNGLWDIRHPNLWGSMWYWDVNIQAAFAGVFSSNHLHLGKVFSDGLLSYRALAEKFAKDIHDLPGCACDYAYAFYYSCFMWCAQYLWYQYEYSLDKEYLKNEAYPLFLSLCRFVTALFTYDSERGCYTVYPDVSPEQGPYAHNTTITVACAKYLLQFTLEAAEILDDHDPVLEDCRRLLEKMPAYAISGDGLWGKHLKDSPDSPDNMFVRHPSMLMPVYPVGELGVHSDPEMRQIICNTVDFLEDKCETGIFGGSWIAAVAARMGRGQTALRLLYEKGIDHMLRSNGLTAEQTDRFMNFCLMIRQPLFYPCMMEFTGEMLAAVNEMLLRSNRGIITVFPALPDGDPEYGRLLRHGYSFNEYGARYTHYEAWKTVRFDKLLAKGAFEISASMSEGKLDYIHLHSKMGGTAQISCPYLTKDYSVYCDGRKIDFRTNGNLLCFETQKGKDYHISQLKCTQLPSLEESLNSKEILKRTTFTKRTISIGENKDSAYQQKLDYCMRAWFLGNQRMENHTAYKFDFTKDPKKDYRTVMPNQAYAFPDRVLPAMSFFPVGTEEFTVQKGYGFMGGQVSMAERKAADVLRSDFAEGSEEAEFLIDAPRGQYEIMLVSGDEDADSVTIAHAQNSRVIGGTVVPAGSYQVDLIPFIKEDEAPIRITLKSKEGYKWKLNFAVLNIIKGY